MKPLYIFIIIFNLLCLQVFAKLQNHDTDSLKKLLTPSLKHQDNINDTLTINRLDKLASAYYETNPDSTSYYGKLQIKLSKKINYTRGIADGHAQIAAVEMFRSNYTSSANNYGVALKLYEQVKYNPGIIDCYTGLGRVQDFLGKYDEALALYNKALAIAKKTNSSIDISDAYNLIGITYDNKGDFSKALDNYFRSLLIDIRNKDELSAADKYCNIGCVMQELELYDKAMIYHKRSLAIWQKLDDLAGVGTACQNIGEVLMAQKKYSEAISYINKASAIFHRMDDREGLSLIYYDLGIYNYNIKRTDSALYYLQGSVQSAEANHIKYNKASAYTGLAMVYNQLKNYREAYTSAIKAQQESADLKSLSIRTEATLQLSAALAGLKRFEEAYNQHQLYSTLKSNLKHHEGVHKIMSYNIEIDFAKKQDSVARQQRERENAFKQKIAEQKSQTWIFGIAIIAMAILAGVYYNAVRRQQKINALLAGKNEEIVAHQESLNAQANKLNELNLLKDRLIGVLAHDLRAPISTLRSLFTLMTDKGISQNEFIEMTPKVFKKLEHTSDFLDTLLFWINSQVDSDEVLNKSFSIAEVVNRELTHSDDQLKQKNINVEVDIKQDALAFADPNCIRIVIHNFLTNAIKFSNRGGLIQIASYLNNDGQVIFCLKDNGVGMTVDCLNSLFKTRVNSATGTENESGTGMGLLFCKDLIEKHHGKVWASSNLGLGSEFCFSLPKGQ